VTTPTSNTKPYLIANNKWLPAGPGQPAPIDADLANAAAQGIRQACGPALPPGYAYGTPPVGKKGYLGGQITRLSVRQNYCTVTNTGIVPFKSVDETIPGRATLTTVSSGCLRALATLKRVAADIPPSKEMEPPALVVHYGDGTGIAVVCSQDKLNSQSGKSLYGRYKPIP
jgi:hypothetical protein